MAEVTGMRNNALPYPVYGLPFVVVAPLLDADGDPISPSSPDSERSLNGDTFADCTNEATEIATSSGICYLLLTAAEMTADIVTVRIQSTGAKTTVLTLYPRKLVVLATGTCQGSNDTGDVQLAAGDSAIDDYYNGCIIAVVVDGTTEVRLINDYVGSTKVAEVAPAFVTAQPDSNDTYTIYLPEGRHVVPANTTHVAGTAQTAGDIIGDTNDIQSRLPAALVSGRMDASVGAMAADTLTASALATDAVTEIQSGLSTLDAAGVRTAVGLASANLDTQLTAIDDYLDTEVAAIKAKTDNLPTDPADASDIAASFSSIVSTLSTIAAYIDTEVSAIKAKTDNLPASPAAVGSSMALTSDERDSVADALLDRASAIDTKTLREAIRIMAAILAGKVSGAGTGTETFVGVDGSTSRAVVTVDSSGNRTGVTYP